LATTYAPPLVSYARTVCVYETTTMARTAAIAIEIGSTRSSAASETPTSTTIAASVAYATDESGSAEKIGRASVFERRVSCISSLGRGLPTRTRFTTPRPSGRSASACLLESSTSCLHA
jgi:hypothetical protein